LALSASDGGLDVGGGGVEAFIENKLQNKVRVSLAAVRSDQLKAGNLHELALERRGDIVRHRFGRGAGVAHLHLNDGIVDSGQVIHRKTAVGEHAKENGGDRQHGGHDRPAYEWF
jgi:hypothetical protein